MWPFGKKVEKKTFDRKYQTPTLKCSICTGEQVAGFRDSRTGAFEEVMLICNDKDLALFMKMYDIEKQEIKKEY